MRIAKVLEIQGLKVNRKRVSRLMRLMGLCPKGTNYKYKKYNQQNKHEEHPNLLNRIFKANAKNKIWVGDITYIPTKKRTLYLAVFLDVYFRRVVGWSMDTKMKYQKKSLNILNYTIILNECTLPLVIFLLPNLKNKIHIIPLTLCPQKIDISKKTAPPKV